MAKILCRTKGNANPKGKPRVYFTCHPDDFDIYFDKIREDIFKTHDCAIFYTEDMNAVIEEQDKATDLESNNLFVVPVTFRLLSQPNRAMDTDIPFAFEKHIPVLPFMMDPGIDDFYSRPDKFGELQYLNPYSTDLTEVSYEEKLKKYLESVLISDEMAKRIRTAFDAYIFLSYRKKDRRYANELMRLIHSHPECRDIAIWFDEFLTPGESFKINIEKALQNSKLFALLVTPSLLEEPNGKPNFVMGEEYPAARKSGIDILPAEMEETNKAQLSQKFDGIPACLDPHDEAFKVRLLESISKIATSAKDNDPMHNFLIGLAYLEGIDVEIDRQRGINLITSAAEQNVLDAIDCLVRMYSIGNYVKRSYETAIKWQEKKLQLIIISHQDSQTIESLLVVLENIITCASLYSTIGSITIAINKCIQGKEYFDQRLFNSNVLDNLYARILEQLALFYATSGNVEKAKQHIIEALHIRLDSIKANRQESNIISFLTSCIIIGDIFKVSGDIKTSEFYYEQALNCCPHIDERTVQVQLYAKCYKSLGTINILLHKFKKAKVCFEESVDLYYKIAKEQPTESAVIELIDAYARIGGLFEKAGDISTAKDFYKRSIHMATIFANKVDI